MTPHSNIKENMQYLFGKVSRSNKCQIPKQTGLDQEINHYLPWCYNTKTKMIGAVLALRLWKLIMAQELEVVTGMRNGMILLFLFFT